MSLVCLLQVCPLKKNAKYIQFGENIKSRKMEEYRHFLSWKG